jgi:phage FluMu protein Com
MSKLYIKCICGFSHTVKVEGYTKICCPECDDIMEYYWDYEEDTYTTRKYEPRNKEA